MRVLVVTILLIQAMAAQAAVSGISCMHVLAAPEAPSASAIHAHEQAAHEHADKLDASHPDRCCCDMVGHCTSSAIETNIQLSIPSDYPVRRHSGPAVASVAKGFVSPPYRPPSPIV